MTKVVRHTDGVTFKTEISPTAHQNPRRLLLLHQWRAPGKARSCGTVRTHGTLHGRCNQVSG